jgi:hypothetical protein
VPNRAAACCFALSLSGALMVPAPSLSFASSGIASPSSDWDVQLELAKRNFADALEAVREAHRLMPIAVEKSVIFEETKANRNKVAKCKADEAVAKQESSDARKEFNKARGRATSAFNLAKSAVSKLRQLDPSPGDDDVRAALPFASDMDAIERSLAALKSKLYDGVNSSLTGRGSGNLWRDAQEYVSALPPTWDRPEASSLVPGSVRIPCTEQTVRMHVGPNEGSKPRS